jgi:hypothetical protein
MLGKLTKEQEQLLETVREEWLDFALRSKERATDEQIHEAIAWNYSLAKLPIPEKIIIVDSPMAAQKVAHKALGKTGKLEYTTFAWEGYWNFPWLSFYDFFRRIGIVKNEKLDECIKHNRIRVWQYIMFDTVCIAVRSPEKIYWDDNKRLHSETNGAVCWEDGYENHFLHGVSISTELFQKIRDRTITGKEVLTLKNVEQKRVIIETLGWAHVLKGMKMKTIHEDGKYKLYECNLGDDNGAPAKFIKVKCPSTGREYILRVAPEHLTCMSAVASTFQKKKEDYAPNVET